MKIFGMLLLTSTLSLAPNAVQTLATAPAASGEPCVLECELACPLPCPSPCEDTCTIEDAAASACGVAATAKSKRIARGR